MSRITNLITSMAAMAGSNAASILANVFIFLYLGVGVIVRFSDRYNMFANCFMSAVSFLLLFVIQNTQNRNEEKMKLREEAVQVKLDAIIKFTEGIEDRFVGIEKMDEKGLSDLKEEIEN